MSNIYILSGIIIALLLNLVLTPIIVKLAHSNEIFDSTDHRKTHKGDIPRLGGIGIYLSTACSYYLCTIIFPVDFNYLLFFAMTIIFITGLVDDLIELRAYIKLLSQLLAVVLLSIGDYTLSHVLVPYSNYLWNFSFLRFLFTLIWIVGVSNAINLLDGMDGQAGGVSLFSAISMGICALISGDANIALLCFILSAAITSFLVFNLPPAKIFMGDSGSLTLGFILAVIPLLFKSPEIKGKMILVSIALLLIPILDVFSAIIRRSKLKVAFFVPDRGHIHHKFLDFTSLSIKKVLGVVYSLVIISGIISVLYLKFTNYWTVTGLFVNLFVHIGLFVFLHKRKKDRS